MNQVFNFSAFYFAQWGVDVGEVKHSISQKKELRVGKIKKNKIKTVVF